MRLIASYSLLALKLEQTTAEELVIKFTAVMGSRFPRNGKTGLQLFTECTAEAFQIHSSLDLLSQDLLQLIHTHWMNKAST